MNNEEIEATDGDTPQDIREMMAFIEKARIRIGSARDDEVELDLSKAEAALGKLEHLVEVGKTSGSKTARKTIERTLKNISRYHEILEQIHGGEEAVRKAKETDAEYSKARGQIIRARNALKKGKFPTASKHVKTAIRLCDTEMKRVQRYKTQERIKAINSLLGSLHERGIETSPLFELLSRARSLLKKNDFKVAMELVEEVQKNADEATNAFENEKMSPLFKTLRERIKTLQDRAMEATALELDVSVQQKALGEEMERLEMNRIDGMDERISELSRTLGSMIDSAKSRSLADDAAEGISYSMAYAMESSRFGIDISEVMASISRAEGAFENGDYRAAMELSKSARSDVDRLKDQHFDQFPKEIIADTKAILDDLEKKGVDVKGPRDTLARARTNFDRKDIISGKNLARVSRDQARAAYMEKVSKEVSERISAADIKIKDLITLGIDTGLVEEEVGLARELLSDEEQFLNAEEHLRKGLSIAENLQQEYQKKQVGDALGSVNALVAELEQEGIDTGDLKEPLRVAKGFFDRGSFMVAMDHINRARDRALALQQKYVFEAARDRYTSARELLDETRDMGLDTSDAEKLLGEVEVALDAEDFSSAKEQLGKFETKTKVLKDNYYSDLAQDTISSSQMLISEARNIGIDISEAETLLKESEEVFKTSDFEKALTLAEKAESITKERWDGFRSDTTASAVSEIKTLFEDTRGLRGIDTSEAEQLIKEAEEALSENDFDTAIDIASQAEDRIIRSKRSFAEEVFPRTYMNTHTIFDEMSANGIDVSGASELLASAEEAFKNQNFLDAQRLMDTAYEQSDDQMHSYLLQTLPSKIGEARSMIEEISGYGIDTSEPERQLMEAENLFQEADLSEAYQNLMMVEDIAQEGQIEYLSQAVPGKLDQAKDMIGEMNSIGIDLGDAEGMLLEAEELFNSKDLSGAKQVADNALEVVQQRRDQYFQEELPQEFSGAESLLQEIESYGLEMGDADTLLREAEALFAQEDFMGAKQQLDQARTMAMDNRGQYLKNMSRSAIVTAETLIDEGRRNGLDISTAEQALADARQALEEEDFDNCRAYVDLATGRAKDVLGTVNMVDIQTDFATTLSEARAELDVALKEGAPVDGVTEIIEEAEQLFRNESDPNNMGQALELVQNAREKARSARMDTDYRETRREIDRARGKVQQLQDIGIDVRAAGHILDQWEKKVAEGDIEGARDTQLELESTLKTLERPYKARQVSAAIISTRALAAEATNEGIKIRGAEGLIAQAETLIQNGETDKAEEAIKKAENSILEARKKRRITVMAKELEQIGSQLAELKNASVDVGEAEDRFLSAQQHYDNEEWDIAFSELGSCSSILDELNRSHLGTMCDTHLQKAHELLKELEAKGIDPAEPKQLLLAAEGLHSRNELEEANQYALNALELARQVMQDHFKQKASSKISDVRDMFVYLKDLKVNVNEPKKSMRKAHASFKNKDYDVAIEFADKALKKLKLLRKPFLEKMAREQLKKATAMVKEAQKSGLRVGHFLEALKLANDASGEGNFEEAEAIATKVYHDAESSRVDIIYYKAQNDIESARRSIMGLKATGVDVSEAEKGLEEATKMLQMRDFVKVKLNVDMARETVKEVEVRNLVHIAGDTIRYAKGLQKFITSNMKKKVDEIRRAELLIGKADIAYSKGNHLAAQRFAEQAVKLIEGISDPDIKQLVYVSRSLQGEEILAEGKDFITKTANNNPGMDLAPLYKLLQDAQVAISKDETFNDGKELVTQAKIAAIELERTSMKETVRNELNAIRVTLMNARRKGIDIDGPSMIFKEAKQAFEANDYRKVSMLCKECNAQINDSKL